jgi:hypothetical protein
MKIELLSVPDCPNVGPVRDLLRSCLDRLGTHAEVVERVGDFPSPTLLINGVDVMGMCVSGGRACRLDLPTEDRVLTALGTAAH